MSECVGCEEFPCADVRHECYIFIEKSKRRMIAEDIATALGLLK